MPLPEGLSEMTFAGALGNRRFRYFYDDEGFCISSDADFVITGTVMPQWKTNPKALLAITWAITAWRMIFLC
jgi:4-hydroxy-3-polyprenylbenzoate decarboxylase